MPVCVFEIEVNKVDGSSLENVATRLKWFTSLLVMTVYSFRMIYHGFIIVKV